MGIFDIYLLVSFSKPFSLRFNSAFVENEPTGPPRVQKELTNRERTADGRLNKATFSFTTDPLLPSELLDLTIDIFSASERWGPC